MLGTRLEHCSMKCFVFIARMTAGPPSTFVVQVHFWQIVFCDRPGWLLRCRNTSSLGVHGFNTFGQAWHAHASLSVSRYSYLAISAANTDFPSPSYS